MSTLRLTYAPEDNWHGELHAAVDGHGFIGSGSAWFTMEKLTEFCDRLGAYPLRIQELPVLEGGYWEDAEDALTDVHLSIRIDPYGSTGTLRVSVSLAEPGWDGSDPHAARSVQTSFLVGYNDMTLFQSALRKMLARRADEAVLKPSPT
jgi:hypothetical protein